MGSNGDVVPLAELRAAHGRIKMLERPVGKQTLELEILRVARDEAKERPRYYSVSAKRPEAPSR